MKFVIIVLSLFSFSQFSQAKGTGPGVGNWEFRVQLGLQRGEPDTFNKYMDTVGTNLGLEGPKVGNVDLLYKLGGNWLFGFRFESIGFDKSGRGKMGTADHDIKIKLSGYRLHALLGYRFLQGASWFAGIMSHVAGMNSMTYQADGNHFTTGVATQYKYKLDGPTGFGAGIEGAYFPEKNFFVGMDVGYSSMVFNNITDANNNVVRDSSSKAVEMDLSGIYTRFTIGSTF